MSQATETKKIKIQNLSVTLSFECNAMTIYTPQQIFKMTVLHREFN